jgi:enoyl-CoA hydratase/carnithine racemase
MPAVVYEKKGHIAYITLNRPEAMNAINREVWEGLTNAWTSVRDDPEVWIGVVTGTGERAFSAGADLKEMAAFLMTPEDQRTGSLVPEITPMRGLDVWKPFIAAINGIATGGGLELAMACDIRIASESARLGLAEVRQALMPGMSGTQRLPRLVPFGIALEILITGDFINAQEAYRIGLVNRVVPPDELMSSATALAERICQNGPLAVRTVKEVAYRGIQMNLDDGINLEKYMVSNLVTSEDAKEGPRAFAEKRPPIFKGR